MDILHANKILPFILEHGEIKKTDLLKVVSSSDSFNKSLRELEDQGFIISKVEIRKRKEIHITLTPKGMAAARAMIDVRKIAQGVTIHEDEGRIEIKEPPEDFKNKWENLPELIHVNVYEDHVTIKELHWEGNGRERIFNIYVRENGQGHLRLWCEEDECFDCYHVGYALTLAPVQEMFVKIRGGK